MRRHEKWKPGSGHAPVDPMENEASIYIPASLFTFSCFFFAVSLISSGFLGRVVLLLVAVNANAFWLMWLDQFVERRGALALPNTVHTLHATCFGVAGALAGLYLFGVVERKPSLQPTLVRIAILLLTSAGAFFVYDRYFDTTVAALEGFSLWHLV